MRNFGYYEIMNHTAFHAGLKASVIAGDLQFNRMHWHDSLEIICCLYGSCSINIQGSSVHLNAGDLVTIDRGLSHEIYDGTYPGLQLIFSVDPSVLHIKKDDGYQYVLSTVGKYALSREHKDIRMARADIAKMACILMEDDDGRQLGENGGMDSLRLSVLENEEQWYEYHGALYRILACLSRHTCPAAFVKQEGSHFTHFARCVEMIHNAYDQPLNAAVVAEAIGFSEPTVYRLFQKHMGMSFNNYLNSVRISAACGFIEKSSLNMTEIAEKCGFLSLSNFYRAFHQFTGMSPRAYRKYRGDGGGQIQAVQKNLMLQNRFRPFWELPYTKADLEKFLEQD